MDGNETVFEGSSFKEFEVYEGVIQEENEVENSEETYTEANLGTIGENTSQPVNEVQPEESTSTVQESKVFFECPNKCGETFMNKEALSKHLKYICGEAKRYKCPHCDLCRKQYWQIVTHITQKHPSLEMYAIDLYNGTIVGLLGQKIKKKESEVKISNVAFETASESQSIPNCDSKPLENEKAANNVKSTNKHICPACHRSYKYMRSLNVHLKFECGQGPRFKCPYCVTYSKYSRNIITHIKLLHPDDERYAIDVVTKKIVGNINKSRSSKDR